MGVIEKEAKIRRRKGQIQQAVLATVGLAGIMLVSMAAPNTLQLLGKFKGNKYRFNNQAKTALSKLASREYVVFVTKNGRRYARITDKGRSALLLETMKLTGDARRRWDKRWRVVMFDISEKRRIVRDSLRKQMRHIGFMRLQDSVWIYPHDCEEVIALLKADLEIGHAVIYMIVEHLENDTRLRQHFGLK